MYIMCVCTYNSMADIQFSNIRKIKPLSWCFSRRAFHLEINNIIANLIRGTSSAVARQTRGSPIQIRKYIARRK